MNMIWYDIIKSILKKNKEIKWDVIYKKVKKKKKKKPSEFHIIVVFNIGQMLLRFLISPKGMRLNVMADKFSKIYKAIFKSNC